MYRLDNSKDIFDAAEHLLKASEKLKDAKYPLSNALLDISDSLLKEVEKTKIICDKEKIAEITKQILKKRRHDLKVFERDYKEITRDGAPTRAYTLEFTTTNSCNWKCEYCFEDGCDRSQILDVNKIPVLIRKTKTFLNSSWFKNNIDVLKLDFWGGEPFLNPKPIRMFMEEFMDDERVIFHAYTNGSRIDPLLDIFQEASTKKCVVNQKILIQFSYDGNPIHDLRRLDKNGNPTSKITLQKAMKTASMGIPISFKATLMIKDFDHFSEAWDDYKNNVFARFQDYGYITYSPTIDYTQNYNTVDLRKDVLSKQLIDIASKEIDFYNKHDRFLLSWFSRESSLCTAGKNMTCVDSDGSLYYCHGAMYSKLKKDLCFGNIFESGFSGKLISNHEKLFECDRSTPEECHNCVADSCYRCNIQKYENSNKKEFMDKWKDFTCMEEMCNYFKLTGEIKFGLIEALTEDI